MSESQIILAVYAHPDDGEFLAGGSLAKWAENGDQIYAICATNGDLGTKDLSISKERLVKIRKKELINAMEILGGNKPIFLNFSDGFLREHISELKERLIYWIRKIKPDRIITFDPWTYGEIHPDHIEVGRMTSEAAVFSCFPLLYPEHLEEGLEVHQPLEVWFMTPMGHRPNRLVDISSTLEKKMKAVFCHQSQLELLADMFITDADPAALSNEEKTQLREGAYNLLRMVAQGLGTLSGGKAELVEAFYAIKVGAGHFDNYQIMLQEVIGIEADPILIL